MNRFERGIQGCLALAIGTPTASLLAAGRPATPSWLGGIVPAVALLALCGAMGASQLGRQDGAVLPVWPMGGLALGFVLWLGAGLGVRHGWIPPLLAPPWVHSNPGMLPMVAVPWWAIVPAVLAGAWLGLSAYSWTFLAQAFVAGAAALVLAAAVLGGAQTMHAKFLAAALSLGAVALAFDQWGRPKEDPQRLAIVNLAAGAIVGLLLPIALLALGRRMQSLSWPPGAAAVFALIGLGLQMASGKYRPIKSTTSLGK
ncbi:MAG: hypothetical protein KGR26_02265 [Cyanobacteria bacterium REEB65]|nr:hypothetical protein [Cyanobacteria bacterium REEB65]